jgi:hypothetical protein
MGTVIGYTVNLNSNLVYYNKASIDNKTHEVVAAEEDYYRAHLFKKKGRLENGNSSISIT